RRALDPAAAQEGDRASRVPLEAAPAVRAQIALRLPLVEHLVVAAGAAAAAHPALAPAEPAPPLSRGSVEPTPMRGGYGYACGMRASSAAPSASRTGAISTRSSTSW